MKKRIAIWLFGGIGTGNFSQGQPVLEKLIRELSSEFEIVVYSQSLINEDYVPPGFKIRTASKNLENGSLRWLFLIRCFVADHFKKRFSVACAFWGFPGGFLATLVSKILFLPSVVSLQGGDAVGIPALNYGVMHRRGFRRLALWTYRNATVLTCLTLFQKDLLNGYGVVRPIRIIPLGVDRNAFKFSTKTKLKDEPHKFLLVSNYNPIKDPETLLKTFAIISRGLEARLRIVGGEYVESNCRQRCEALGIATKVDFSGPSVYGSMHNHYEWADTILHTSLYEGQGIVIAEAAMSGVLIAGTAVGLISDLGDSGALRVLPGDFEGLAKKVIDAVGNSSQCEAMRKVALEWATQHDLSWTVNQYKKIFNELS